MTATQFLNTLGVNVHVEYTDGKYANAANVIADLAYLGETHVRDAVLNPNNQGQASYDALAAAGIKFDLFLQGNDLSSTLALVDAFVTRHPGAVSMIEGPNEVNNFPISYAGQSGATAATAYQSALYSAVKGDSLISSVPVADLTSYPFLGGPSDLANFHFYPFGGAQPSAAYGSTLTDLAADDPGKPIVMTEGGYNTLLTDSYFGGVDEATQAKLLLNLYCDDAKYGVNVTYIYQLLDAYSDPSGSNSDDHFGLFNLDNTPKLAATAIHNLTTVLANGADPTVAPSSLSFSVDDLPSLGSVLTLTKSSTTHDILIWNEPSIWNGSSHTPIAAASTSVDVRFATPSSVTVFDPLVSSQPIATYAATQDVVVAVTDHPLIIEVSSVSTPAAQPVADGATLVPATAPAAEAPVLTGLAAMTLDDHTIASPFAAVSLSDTGGAQTETVTVTFDASGGALSGGDFSQTAPGVYQVTASSAAAAQADLRAVSFTPSTEPSGSPDSVDVLQVSASNGSASATGAATLTVTAPSFTASPPLIAAQTSVSSTPSDSGTTTTTTTTTGPASATATASAAPILTQATVLLEAENLMRASAGDGALTDLQTSLGSQMQTAKTLSAQLVLGQTTSDAVQSALFHDVDGTTSVAELTYAFFTGSTPTAAGLSYLVHSDANASDLNDPYYAQFSVGNRYINFAVALAKGGSGTAAFHSAYDGLTLSDAAARAYTAVFGSAASSDKIAAILNAQVSDGLGGTETRAQYFAGYGGDGLNGTGTKAAMIGWLLGESVSEGVGTLQAAETHFLQDLAHGTAQFGVDLLAAYASAPTLVGQVAADPSLIHG